jgi:hypothetical protein
MQRGTPGYWIHAVLRRCASRARFDELIEPTLADFQHELSEAATLWQRSMARARGYSSLVRVLVFSGLQPDGLITRSVVLLLVVWFSVRFARWAQVTDSDPKLVNSALLLSMFAAPWLMRVTGFSQSYWRLFVAAFLAGLLTRFGAGPSTPDTLSLAVQIVRLGLAGIPIALASIVTATAFWKPSSGRRSMPQQLVVAAFAGGCAAALAFGPVVLWPHGTDATKATAMIPFYVSLFALLFSVTLGAPMLLLRRWIRGRPGLAIAASVLSPAVICSSSYLDGGTFSECVAMFRAQPAHFLFTGSPFVLGAVVLGWTLASLTAANGSFQPQATRALLK